MSEILPVLDPRLVEAVRPDPRILPRLREPRAQAHDRFGRPPRRDQCGWAVGRPAREKRVICYPKRTVLARSSSVMEPLGMDAPGGGLAINQLLKMKARGLCVSRLSAGDLRWCVFGDVSRLSAQVC